MSQQITIWNLSIPDEEKQQARDIVNLTGYRSALERQKHTETLTRIFLMHIEAHQWQPRKSYEEVVKKWLTCSKCIDKVWSYFEERFENYEHE